jgi:hypothetical protein
MSTIPSTINERNNQDMMSTIPSTINEKNNQDMMSTIPSGGQPPIAPQFLADPVVCEVPSTTIPFTINEKNNQDMISTIPSGGLPPIAPQFLADPVVCEVPSTTNSKNDYVKICCVNIGDYFWYIGHVTSAFSLMSLYWSYLSIVFIVIGQSITMISRPIGRIGDKKLSSLCCLSEGDFLWYLGHMIMIGSFITLYFHYMSIPFIVIGQSITMISRPIGRIGDKKSSSFCCLNKGDFLWYLGHIIMIVSLIGLYWNYLAIPFVVVGHLITMISRPVSRLSNT